MSKIFVDQVDPKTGTTLTLGTSGDTVSIPSGVTIDNAGTATGFGVSLANGVNNRVVTSSSATALNGESSLTFDGTTLLSTSGASGATASSSANNVVADGNSASGNGISILSKNDSNGSIFFGDAQSNSKCIVKYDHSTDLLKLDTAAATAFIMNQSGQITKPLQPAFLILNNGYGQSIPNAYSIAKVTLGDEIFDTGNNYNHSTLTWTAATTGKYQFDAAVVLDAGTSNNTRFANLFINILASNRKATFGYNTVYTNEDDKMSVNGSCLIDMDASDTVELQVFASRHGASGATTVVGSATDAVTFLSGFLVS